MIQKIAKFAWKDFKEHVEQCKPIARHFIKYSVAATVLDRSGIIFGTHLALGVVFLGALQLAVESEKEDNEEQSLQEIEDARMQEIEILQMQRKKLMLEELKSRFLQIV